MHSYSALYLLLFVAVPIRVVRDHAPVTGTKQSASPAHVT
jgi:hypothetical protein